MLAVSQAHTDEEIRRGRDETFGGRVVLDTQVGGWPSRFLAAETAFETCRSNKWRWVSHDAGMVYSLASGAPADDESHVRRESWGGDGRVRKFESLRSREHVSRVERGNKAE